MREVTVSLPSGQYPILIGAGLLDRVGEQIVRAGLSGSVFVVTDSGVGPLYAERVLASLARAGIPALLHTVPAGEQSKCLAEYGRGLDTMASAGLERSAIVLALGGGVVGDLAGFLAATYLRGVRLVQAPTSLLAQVDSSVGGKTGIDLAAGKNLAGAFHQPQLVLADTAALQTLPPRELRAGLAEVVKYGVILDPELFESLELNSEALLNHHEEITERTVERCCRLKARVVEADEKETGLRAVLNYGHTIGHAIEAVAGYGIYLHGEAISIGMSAAGWLSCRRVQLAPAEAGRIDRLLSRFGLPIRLARELDENELLAAMSRDKKSRGGALRFVLARRIGQVELHEVTSADALAAVAAIAPGSGAGG